MIQDKGYFIWACIILRAINGLAGAACETAVVSIAIREFPFHTSTIVVSNRYWHKVVDSNCVVAFLLCFSVGRSKSCDILGHIYLFIQLLPLNNKITTAYTI